MISEHEFEAAPNTRLYNSRPIRDRAQDAALRFTVWMIDFEERSYREAADELGVPLGTVMSRLHRGRKLLASKLRDAA